MNERQRKERLSDVVLVAVLVVMIVLAGFCGPARAEAPDNGSCAVYHCVYEHCPARPGLSRSDRTAAECPRGVADHHLPDGPDGRRFIGQEWPWLAIGGHDVGDIEEMARGVMVDPDTPVDPDRFWDWRHIIHCESRWDPLAKNPRSSASSMFQFLDRSWRWVGGGEWASSARWAGPLETLAGAERLLRLQPNGWLCAGEPAPLPRGGQ